MKYFSIFLLLTAFSAFGAASVFAQAAPARPSAKEEFESYERNFSQVEPAKPVAKPAKPAKKPVPTKKPTAKPIVASTGMPGMKIWLEKQAGCKGAYLLAAPSSIFKTGDCVRARFRLNFQGYLTIFNYGSSGAIDRIYPLENQGNRIAPKTDHFLPDNRGWEFFNETGNENLFFIVSKLPLADNVIEEIESRRNITSDSPEEIYDRDLRPRTEKDEIFILAGEARLEKPLIFRLALKHR